MNGALWARFNKLVANPPRQIASVVAVDTSNNVVTVQYLGGSIADIMASGSYTVGQKVFVQGNEIKSEAPDLAYFEAEV